MKWREFQDTFKIIKNISADGKIVLTKQLSKGRKLSIFLLSDIDKLL